MRRVEQHVGQQRQEAVARVVPEQVRALRLAAAQARAVDDVGDALQQRPDELGHVARVVLEVGVLDDHELAADGVEPAPHGRALAAVAVGADHPQPVAAELGGERSAISGVPSVEPSSTTTSSVWRSIGVGAPEHVLDRGRLVVGGHEQGDQRAVGHEGSAILAAGCGSGSCGQRRDPRARAGDQPLERQRRALDQVPAGGGRDDRRGQPGERPGEVRVQRLVAAQARPLEQRRAS